MAPDRSPQSRDGEVSDAASPSVHTPFLQTTESQGSYQPRLPESVSRVSSYFPSRPNGEMGITSICVVVFSAWSLVAVFFFMGFYGNSNMELGPNCSILIKPNPVLVDHIKVEQLPNKSVQGQMLYGFYQVPPLDVVTQWSESHNVSLPLSHRKDLKYFFNEGSQINISYNVNSSSLILAIVEESNNGVAKWIQDMSYPSATLSWNIIRGNGMIRQDFKKSSTYYIGVINWNLEAVEVNLNLEIKNILYDTSEAYFKCTFDQGECSMKIFFPEGNYAVLTTPGLKEGMSSDDWPVILSYAPRWNTYIALIGGMSLMLAAFYVIAKCICHCGNRILDGEMGPTTRVSILSQKDEDDLSSWGSSYDSGSQDGDDHEDGQLVDGKVNINTQRHCVICFDSPRDSFFIPCGHCAVCFACGTRVVEALKSCPICRRRTKKIKKIYTV